MARVNLHDDDAAEAAFERALAQDPDHLPSLRALSSLARGRGDLATAASWLERAAFAHLHDAALARELGAVYEALGLRDDAAEAYRMSLAADDDPDTAARLAALLWDHGPDSELADLLERIPETGDRETDAARLVRLARAADALGDADRAAGALARAARFTPEDRHIQRALSEHLFERGVWAEAHAALSRAIAGAREELPPADGVVLRARLGVCALELGDEAGARAELEAALAVDPRHRPALVAMARLEPAPEQLVEIKRTLAELSTGTERRELLVEVGDLLAGDLADPERALAAYREAAVDDDCDHLLLHKCLDQAVAIRDWTGALAIVDRLVATESAPAVRAKYRYTGALLCRDELGDTAATRDRLRASLRDDPDLDRAARALEDTLRARGEWRALAEHLCARAKHLGLGVDDGRTGERVRVWSALGDTCADRLRETESAIDAFEVAARLEPTRLSRREHLADLCERAGAAYRERAIGHHQVLLAADRRRVRSYRALARLYREAGKPDRERAVYSALRHVAGAPAAATPELPPLTVPAQPLSPEHWARLRHADEDVRLSALFAAAVPAVATSPAAGPRPLRRKPIAGPHADRVRRVAAVLGVPRPAVHADPGQAAPVHLAVRPTRRGADVALVLGGPAIRGELGERELLFALGDRLARLRPERIARLLVPDAHHLSVIVDAARALGTGGGDVPAGVETTVASLRAGLAPVAVDRIAALGRELADIDAGSAVRAWLRAADATAARAGLAIAGDLDASVRAVEADPELSDAARGHRVLDLAWSSVTDGVAAVRAHLESPAPVVAGRSRAGRLAAAQAVAAAVGRS